MQLILVNPGDALCAMLEQHFAGLPDLTIVQGYFENLDTFDAMVSAGNSFGLMDGGVDAAIIRYFGPDLMRRVQHRILEDYRGEQPVGTAFVTGTGDPLHPYLVHAPTMRVPMTIAHTDNVYCAMRAMLLAAHHHNRRAADDPTLTPIDHLACPGLGTGTGQVPPAEAAYQMALAYRRHLDPPRILDWPTANAHQRAIHYGGDAGFEHPRPTR